MRRSGLAEWLLKRAAGAERGTAMYGDLVELAAARGKAWFWLAYARTMLSFTWRTPVAFACGFAAFQLLAFLAEFWLTHTPGAWRDHLVPLLVSVGPALAAVTVTLWIGVPYLILRYGVRDPITQLAFVLLMLDSTAFLYIPWLSFSCAGAAALLTLAALSSRKWRKAAMVLIPSVVAGSATFACALGGIALATRYVTEQIHPNQLINPSPIPGAVMNAAVLIAMVVICSACSLMHRWLLPIAPTAGGADA